MKAKIKIRVVLAIVLCLMYFVASTTDTPKIVAATVMSSETSTELECDDTCFVEEADPVPGRYAVVAPVGRQTIQMITQAPRLDTLAGKTIAIVGGSFMAYVTHPEIKRLILENYPTAKVILLEEIGSAGPFPGPGVTRKSVADFQKKLKSMGVNAVISGWRLWFMYPQRDGLEHSCEYIGIRQ